MKPKITRRTFARGAVTGLAVAGITAATGSNIADMPESPKPTKALPSSSQADKPTKYVFAHDRRAGLAGYGVIPG